MKKKVRTETKLLDISKRLKQLNRETNLDDPEAVKAHIANKRCAQMEPRVIKNTLKLPY